MHADLTCSVVWLVRSLLPYKWHLSVQVMRSVCYTHITTLLLSANSEDELPLFTDNNKFICFSETRECFYVWLKQIYLFYLHMTVHRNKFLYSKTNRRTNFQICSGTKLYSGLGSVLGIATAYGWTVRGSNPSGGEIFRTCPDRPWGPPSLLYNGYRVFPAGKVRPGRDADPSPPSSAGVNNRVEL
jgi:hypothetical protein